MYKTLNSYHLPQNLELDGHDITGVRVIEVEGAIIDDFQTRLVCTEPTQDNTITFDNRTFTVNAANELSGTTLKSTVVNTSIQNTAATTFSVGSNIAVHGGTTPGITTSNSKDLVLDANLNSII